MEFDLGGTVYALGWSLVHFLWQGALIALALEAVLVALRKSSSDVRYTLRCTALALMALAPVITFLVIRPGQPAAAAAAPLASLVEAATTTPAGSWSGVTWLAAIVALWSIGSGILGVRLLRDYLRIRRLQNNVAGGTLPLVWQIRFDNMAATLGVRAIARVVDSAALTAPAVIGWMKPMVLLPARVLTGLTGDQIEALIAHELAHVRRHDFAINLLQTALEALLFYHPAVWWVSKGIRAEREYCCDDMALRVTTDEVAYARALTTLESWRGVEPQIGMSTLGGSLMLRIQRMLGIRPSAPRARVPLTALGVLLVASTLGATAFGYAAPQDPELLRELRAEMSELRGQIAELRSMLGSLHGSVVRKLHPNSFEHEHDSGNEFHFESDDHDGNEFHFGPDRDDDLHEHVQRALEDAGVDWVHEGDARFNIRIDGEELHEHIQKALKQHGSHGNTVIDLHDGADGHHGQVIELHGDIDLGQIHERVRQALERSGIHDRHGKQVIELKGGGDVDLEELHEHLQRVLESSGLHGRGDVEFRTLHELKELEGIEELEGLHGHLREALEASGIHRLKVDLSGLGELEHLEGLHGLSVELDALDESDGRIFRLRGLGSDDKLELDGEFRIEVRTLNGDDAGSGVRVLKRRKHADSPEVEITINGERVDASELDGKHRIFLRKGDRGDRDDERDLLHEIRKAREEAKAKERKHGNAL